MIYTLTLNPAIDYFMEFDEPISKHQKTQTFNLLAGGKGINASIMLNNFGIKNKAILVTGGLIGEKLLEEVSKLKIDFINVKIKSETRINVKSNFLGETYELNSSGEKVDPVEINTKLLNIFKENIKEGDTILIMGSLAPGYQFSDLEALVSVLHNMNVKLVFDLSQDFLLKLSRYRPEVIKPNKKELSEMFGVKIDSEEQILEYAQKLIDLGAKRVIVSMDKSGSLYIDEKLKLKIDGVKIKEVNGSGAGDSMIAGFVVGLSKNDQIKQILQIASACGTATAASEGIADKEKVLFYKDKIDVKEI